jgi:hypothetical protein
MKERVKMFRDISVKSQEFHLHQAKYFRIKCHFIHKHTYKSVTQKSKILKATYLTYFFLKKRKKR